MPSFIFTYQIFWGLYYVPSFDQVVSSQYDRCFPDYQTLPSVSFSLIMKPSVVGWVYAKLKTTFSVLPCRDDHVWQVWLVRYKLTYLKNRNLFVVGLSALFVCFCKVFFLAILQREVITMSRHKSVKDSREVRQRHSLLEIWKPSYQSRTIYFWTTPT